VIIDYSTKRLSEFPKREKEKERERKGERILLSDETRQSIEKQ